MCSGDDRRLSRCGGQQVRERGGGRVQTVPEMSVGGHVAGAGVNRGRGGTQQEGKEREILTSVSSMGYWGEKRSKASYRTFAG